MDEALSPETSIGIIGHGAFGQLTAQHLARHFRLVIFDRRGPSASAGGTARHATSLAQVAGCDIIILAVPVQQLEAVCQALAPLLKPNALVLDVSSVKVLACQIMARSLPSSVRILGTHPLFGPQSAATGIAGLKLVLCPVRRAPLRAIAHFCETALGLKVIITAADEHDRQLALSQGLTHFLSAVLRRFSLPQDMTTVSFDLITRAAQMVAADSLELLEAIESWNPHSQQVRRQFLAQALAIDQSLQERASTRP